jgi:hypothetical protein
MQMTDKMAEARRVQYWESVSTEVKYTDWINPPRYICGRTERVELHVQPRIR